MTKSAVSLSITIFLGVLVSGLACYAAYRVDRDLAVATLSHHAGSAGNQLSTMLELNLDAVQALAAFMASSQFVHRDEFTTYTTRILDRHRGLVALEWVPWVDGNFRTEWERMTREARQSDFEFREKGTAGMLVRAADREDYFPVYYVRPLTGNEAVIGFDLGSEPVRRQSIETALATGKPTSTPSVQLLQARARGWGTLFIVPIHEQTRNPAQDPTGPPSGVNIGVVSFSEIVTTALRESPLWVDDIALRLVEGEDRVIFHRGMEDMAWARIVETIQIPIRSMTDRNWRLEVDISGNHLQRIGTPWPMAVLLIGLLVTMVLGMSQLVLIHNTRRIQEEVERRTSQLRETNRKLEEATSTDGLTNVANRRLFDKRLDSEWRRLQRSRGTLGILLIDVDYFKRYNDYYGHQRGDACLVQVAQTLRKSVYRAGDLVARYGGEEFAIILPESNSTQLQVMAEKVLNNVRALRAPHEKSQVAQHITVSVGGAAVVPGEGNSIQELIQRADEALYEAKANGRDRAIIAGA